MADEGKTLGQLVFEEMDQSGAGWREKWRDHPELEKSGKSAAAAAVRSLLSAGWTYHGGEYWAPVIGGNAVVEAAPNVGKWRPLPAVFVNDGAEPDYSHLNCPACLGSGHVDDVEPARRALIVGALASCPSLDGMPVNAPESAAVAVNHQGVVVDRGYPWQPMATCPMSAKVQLLGGGGIAYYGTWNGKDSWPKRWAPVPKLVDGPL